MADGEQSQRRFRAFLSYARRDSRVAGWLHRKLDTYRTPKELTQSGGAHGPVPATLHPIFRDRSDLSGGGSLSEKIRTALADSEALTVLCSPAAAASEWVDRECAEFVRLGRSSRVLPVLAWNLPAASDIENAFYPPSLRGLGLLACDLRSIRMRTGQVIGDGRTAGFQKLVAGLLGIELDALARRERRRQRFVTATLAAVAVIFAGVAAMALWSAYRANEAEDVARHERDNAEQRRTEAVFAAERERLAREAETAARTKETLAREAESVQRLAAEAAGVEASTQRDAARQTLGQIYADRAWLALQSNEPYNAMRFAIAGASVAGRPSAAHAGALQQAIAAAGSETQTYQLKGSVLAVSSPAPINDAEMIFAALGSSILTDRTRTGRTFAMLTNRQIELVDIETGSITATIPVDDPATIRQVLVAPGGKRVVWRTRSSLTMFDVGDGKKRWTRSLATADDKGVSGVWPTPDRFLLLEEHDHSPEDHAALQIVNAATGELLTEGEISLDFMDGAGALQASPDGKLVLVKGDTFRAENATDQANAFRRKWTLVDLQRGTYRSLDTSGDDHLVLGDSGELGQVRRRYGPESQPVNASILSTETLQPTRSLETGLNADSALIWDPGYRGAFAWELSRQQAIMRALRDDRLRKSLEDFVARNDAEERSTAYVGSSLGRSTIVAVNGEIFIWNENASGRPRRLNVKLDAGDLFVDLPGERAAFINRLGRVTVFTVASAGPSSCQLTDKDYLMHGFAVSPDGATFGYWSGENYFTVITDDCRTASSSNYPAVAGSLDPFRGLPGFASTDATPRRTPIWTVSAITQKATDKPAASSNWYSTRKGEIVLNGDGLLRSGQSQFQSRDGYTGRVLATAPMLAPEGGSSAMDAAGSVHAVSYPDGSIKVFDTADGKVLLDWGSGIVDPIIAAVNGHSRHMLVFSREDGGNFLVSFGAGPPVVKKLGSGNVRLSAYDVRSDFSHDGRWVYVSIPRFGVAQAFDFQTQGRASSFQSVDATSDGNILRFEPVGFSGDSRQLFAITSDGGGFGGFDLLESKLTFLIRAAGVAGEGARIVEARFSPATPVAALVVEYVDRLTPLTQDGGRLFQSMILLVNTETGTPLARYELQSERPPIFRLGGTMGGYVSGTVGAMSFSGDGSRLIWLARSGTEGYSASHVMVPRLGVDFDNLRQAACDKQLTGLERIFRFEEFASDPLVRQTWKRDQDVCTGTTWVSASQ